jgi:hypothetical protein
MVLVVACSDDDDAGPTATTAAAEVQGREELRNEVAEVYGPVQLPANACDAETVNALIDLNFDRLENGGDADSFADGMVIVASEVNGLQEATSAEGAEQLYEDIAAVVEGAYRSEGADEGTVEGKMTEWRLNSLLDSSFTQDAGCTVATD